MSLWTSPQILPPAAELLVRRWKLPPPWIPVVEELLAAEAAGATALLVEKKTAENLPATAAVGSGSDNEEAPAMTPLVRRTYQGETYVQSWRYFAAEQTLAREFLRRADAVTSGAGEGAREGRPYQGATDARGTASAPSQKLASTPKARAKKESEGQLSLFPGGDEPIAPSGRELDEIETLLGRDALNPRQHDAVKVARAHRLALISGGPGTGKTHTIARLLALLLEAEPKLGPQVCLAAPTGKAADRMREAVELAADQLPTTIRAETKTALKRIAVGASTLHRLLRFDPTTGRCRFNRNEPLPCEVLIIDECSMVDTLLWQAVLLALKPECRLILVGDPHQLESVSAGDVLGTLVRVAQAGGPLARVWVQLTESQRFKHRPGIGALAEAVVNYQSEAALTLVHAHHWPLETTTVKGREGDKKVAAAVPPDDGLVYLGDHAGRFAVETLPTFVREALAEVAFATTPSLALAALNRVRILAAHRDYSFGVAGINRALQQHFEQLARARDETLATNVPIIVSRNDPETGLSNGSIGVLMTVAGVRRAYFPPSTTGAPPRSFAAGQLPDYELAWSMTIHRSQGSEFDHVVVILPRDDSPLATRELLYTAITRARSHVYLFGSDTTLRAALSQRAVRCTLLEAALAKQHNAK